MIPERAGYKVTDISLRVSCLKSHEKRKTGPWEVQSGGVNFSLEMLIPRTYPLFEHSCF
jgi:hypothetical protein